MTQCASIRGKDTPGERCSCKPQKGSEWCGRHKITKVRFVAALNPATVVKKVLGAGMKPDALKAVNTIRRSWLLYLHRRVGPLLHYRAESNNPYDFFSSDPIDEIPLKNFTSFVDSDGKGYIMDIQSATSLMTHAVSAKEIPLNPFNRAPLPALFIRRIKMHNGIGWSNIKPLTEEQKLSLAVTDAFRLMEDQGYYTDPQWFIDLSRRDLQRLYLEIADIWMHRAALSATDQYRIVPLPAKPIKIATRAAIIMQLKALRPLLLETCKTLVSSASESSDRRLGVMYFLGALSCVSPGAASAYPWLVEMFSPGCVTRIVGGDLHVIHPSVLSY